MAGGRVLVDPPLFTPTPYGLLSAVDYPNVTDSHWELGITYQPHCTTPASTYDECIAVTGAGVAPPAPPSFTQGSTVTIAPRGATAFTVFQEFDCSAIGGTVDEARLAGVAALDATEGWQVERSFWTGLAGTRQVVFPHLAADTQVVDGLVTGQVAGGATGGAILLQDVAIVVTGGGDLLHSPSEALGLLEGALADCYNGVGIIHVPQVVLPSFGGLIEKSGPRYMTKNGNKVAIGAGYPGTAPSGAARAPDTSWVYATGNVDARRSQVRVVGVGTDGFDRAKNTRKMIAQRTYVLNYDCCHFGVNVALGAPKGT